MLFCIFKNRPNFFYEFMLPPHLFPPMSLVPVHLLCQKLFHPRRDRKRESQVSVIMCESKSESHVLPKFFSSWTRLVARGENTTLL